MLFARLFRLTEDPPLRFGPILGPGPREGTDLKKPAVRYLFVSWKIASTTRVTSLLEPRIEELRKVFPDTKAIIFSAGHSPQLSNEGVDFVSLGSVSRLWWHLVYPFRLRRWLIDQRLSGTLILRRGVFPNPLLHLVLSLPFLRVFTEHHTVRHRELAVLKRVPAKLLKPLYQIENVILNPYIAGKICVTEEIAKFERHRNVLVIGNSILEPRGRKGNQVAFHGRKLNVAMPISETFPWHGEERLLKSALAWVETEPDLSVTVNIFGVRGSESRPHERLTVYRRGAIPEVQLRQELEKAHLGISSLALFKKGMEEACPLKSRVFVSARLPFVYGYRDPDIHPPASVALRVPNDNSLIPWKIVSEFLQTNTVVDQSAEWDRLQGVMSIEQKIKKVAVFIGAQDQCD